MKIAMLTNNYRPFVGGVPISVERQAQYLIERGHEVTVFAPEYHETMEDRECPERVVRFHTRKRTMENGMVYPAVLIQEVTDVFERESFDLIHVHHPMFTGPCALYLGKKYGIPVVYTWHTRYEDYLHYIRCLKLWEKSPWFKRRLVSLLKERLVPQYMRWFTNQCDIVLAPSHGMKKQILVNGTYTRTEVFPTGLAEEFYTRSPKRSGEIRRKYLNGRKYLLCSVSRLEMEKNPLFLLEGIAELKKHVAGGFRVLLIGDGSLREELKKRAEDLGLSEDVVFVGNIANEEVREYLQACDLFLFASKSETQGIVLAEAMAAGLPVNAVRAVGVDDVVENGYNGFATPEDTEIWAESAAAALEAKTHEAMRTHAEETAMRYKACVLAAREEELYRQCIARKQAEIRACRERRAEWTFRERRSRI